MPQDDDKENLDKLKYTFTEKVIIALLIFVVLFLFYQMAVSPVS